MEGKDTYNKPKLSLVPPEILTAVARIREYGCQKYDNPNNWENVPPQEFFEAVIRHTKGAWKDWTATDEESGMPHIWHIACNISFLCAFLEHEKVEIHEKHEEAVAETDSEKEQPKKPVVKKKTVAKKPKSEPRNKIDIQKVLELRTNGLKNKEIADYFGVKPQSISAALWIHKKQTENTAGETPEEEHPSELHD